MQNQGPPYQGPVSQGPYPDHNYNNQMSPHCPPAGYQPYMNGPYPVSNSRTHHYSNQHLQQGPNQLPYRGNYGPPPGQYVPPPPPPNQEMYRNHHPVFVGNNNRTFHGKTVWGDNNSGDMVPSYNHGPSHPQMMNNSGPINVSSMRSPPHLASSVNPVPSPGSQHYRQMHSPGHSPQTWPQVQVPSPGMHPVARTTPSPLQSHARSPGHSQPFSPSASTHMPSSVNMSSHPIPSVVPENQSAQMVNQGLMPAGPLDSLQKMVMLEPDTNSMQLNCELSNDNCEPHSVCSSNSVPQDEQNPHEETKDSSSFATYYNLDENRLESKPQTTTDFKGSSFDLTAPVGEVPCSPQIISNNSDDPCSDISQMSDRAMPHSQPSYVSIPPGHGKGKCNASSSVDMPNGLSKCLPDTPSIEINQNPSEKPSEGEKCNDLEKGSQNTSENVASVDLNQNICNKTLTGENTDSPKDLPPEADSSENITSLKYHDEAENSRGCAENTAGHVENTFSGETCVEDTSDSPLSTIKQDDVSDRSPYVESTATNSPAQNAAKELDAAQSIEKSQPSESMAAEANDASNHVPDEDEAETETCHTDVKSPKTLCTSDNIAKPKLISVNSKTFCKALTLSSGTSITSPEATLACTPNKLLSIGKTRISTSDIARNPVKVVIHRIRTNSTNDTWHVPKSNGSAIVDSADKLPLTSSADGSNIDGASRASKIGPQIIILSPAMSRKKFGLTAAGNPKSVVAVKTEKTNSEVTDSSAETSQPSAMQSQKKKRKGSNAVSEGSPVKQQSSSISKKRGRPYTAPAKPKSATLKKKRKGKQKDTKKRKPDIGDIELPPKPKKLKPFAGPYVRLTGSKSSPSSIAVINVAVKEEEKGKNLRTKAAESVMKRPRVGHTSTLSPHYDAFNKDRTWLCAFCHKGSHCNGLGDLYGPYYIKGDGMVLNMSVDVTAPPCSTRGIRSKRRKSDASATECAKSPVARKMAKQACKTAEQRELPEPIQNAVPEQMPPPNGDNPPHEVWIHEDCAVWCQGVSLMGSQICGLEDAVQEASKNMCSCCKLFGATLGCWCKGCSEQYHFSCAKEKGCKLNIENFSLFCPKHKEVRYMEKEKRTS